MPTPYFNTLHDFSDTIPRCHKDVYVNSFFPRIARLWSSFPAKCIPFLSFPLTYDLDDIKSGVYTHI